MISTLLPRRLENHKSYLPTAIPTAILRRDFGDGTLMSLFRRMCGIYFLMRGERVVYIGKSIDIVSRISTHASALAGVRRKLRDVENKIASRRDIENEEYAVALRGFLEDRDFDDAAYFLCPEELLTDVEAALLYFVRPIGGGPVFPSSLSREAVQWLSSASGVNYAKIIYDLEAGRNPSESD